MGFGTNIMKSLMFIFNGIVWVLGLVLFVVGIVVLIEGENWNDIIDNKTVPVSVLLIVVGLVIAIVGFLGCFGAMKQNTSMLLIYAVILGVIILVQLVAGILAFIFSDEAQDYLQEGLTKGLQDYGKADNTLVDNEESVWTTGIDWMQENMECCGIQGAEDWSRDNNLATWWISTTGGNHVEDTPDSCCKIADGAEEVTAGCGTSAATGIVATVYNGGCYQEGVDWIKTYAMIMGVCGIGFLVFELICVILAVCLRKRAQY